jgi:hypothetical protein
LLATSARRRMCFVFCRGTTRSSSSSSSSNSSSVVYDGCNSDGRQVEQQVMLRGLWALCVWASCDGALVAVLRCGNLQTASRLPGQLVVALT